jgi:hypothetical protein
MHELGQAPRFIGYVHVRVGTEVVALAIQSVPFMRDGGAARPGGFFMDASGDCGILVDSVGTEGDVQDQINLAIADAVAYISRRILN